MPPGRAGGHGVLGYHRRPMTGCADPTPPAARAALRLADFDLPIPEALVAREPAARRDGSRLLVVPAQGPLVDERFDTIAAHFDAGDVLVVNDTRVLRARLAGRKATGGRIEVLIERITGPMTAVAQLRASHAPRADDRLQVGDASARVTGRSGRFHELAFDCDVAALLEAQGRLPLPPYLGRDAGPEDETRYQTVYARHPGAVAAPTAGLHFTQALLAALQARGVIVAPLTLHVGAGTFLPVQTDDIAAHRMHAERYHLPQATADAIAAARRRGSRIVATGTTSLRALEAAAQRAGTDGQAPLPAGDGETDIFITPGFRFRVVDRLITNFHLPRSTLLMLVAAFAGLDTIRAAYAHAVAQRYRFFSYGDAMLLERRDPDSLR